MLYILALSFTAALFMYEPSDGQGVGTNMDQLLPTPQSKSSPETTAVILMKNSLD